MDELLATVLNSDVHRLEARKVHHSPLSLMSSDLKCPVKTGHFENQSLDLKNMFSINKFLLYYMAVY